MSLPLVQPLRRWLRRRRQAGHLRWVVPPFVYTLNLVRYHSFQRFRNYWEYRSLIASGRCEATGLNGDIRNGVFYLLRSRAEGAERFVKIPRLDNPPGHRLQKALRSAEAQQRYAELLQSLATAPHWARHFPKVFLVRPDGGYTSEYVCGPNLFILGQLLRANQPLPEGVAVPDLRRAVRELLDDLEAYRTATGRMAGDWAPHNLIYDSERGVIKNVDLEGQFLYDANDRSTDMEYIRTELAFLDTLLELRGSANPDDQNILRTFALITYATGSGSSYSGRQFHSGYHSLTLKGRYFRGQRECATRLAGVPFDFQDKVVLDIGCNCGGMLHALAGRIRTGVGIDYDYKCINAANAIRLLNETPQLRFFTFDLERDELRLIENYLQGERVDICFLLSICMWIRNWREVIARTAQLADHLLFEANGSVQQQQEQIEELGRHFQHVEQLRADSPDDTIQQKRMLFLCRNEAAVTGRSAT